MPNTHGTWTDGLRCILESLRIEGQVRIKSVSQVRDELSEKEILPRTQTNHRTLLE